MWLDAGSAHTCTDYVYSEPSKKTLDLHKIVKIEMLNQVKYAESWFFFYKLKEKMAKLVWNAKSFFKMHSSTAFGGAWCNFRGIICSKLIKTYQQPIVSYFTNHPFGSREVTRRQRCTWPFDSLSLGQVWLEALSAKIGLPLHRSRHTAAFRMAGTLQRTLSFGSCLNLHALEHLEQKKCVCFLVCLC
jgi:hypothetical protein